jgi:hypothetical protein
VVTTIRWALVDMLQLSDIVKAKLCSFSESLVERYFKRNVADLNLIAMSKNQ